LTAHGIKAARSTLDRELKRWVRDNYAGQTGTGKKGSPHRYWLIATPPDAFFRSKPPSPSEESMFPNPTVDAESVIDAGEPAHMVSSDARSASEPRIAAGDHASGSERIRSSDAPDAYVGRKQASAQLAGMPGSGSDARTAR
jgi:hypothetical protein